jgi:deazaflavin-dependent oxidoreductase (nitroreductase family)
LAIIENLGRKSGRQYKTPILAFPTMSGYVFALTYGRNVDWAKNLQAATHGVLHYNGNSIRVHDFRYTSYEETKKIFPDIVKLFLELLHVNDCVLAEK